MDNEPKFKLGDKVFMVQSGWTSFDVTCPDCFGKRAMIVILGDGTEVGIDCQCCGRGYDGPAGKVTRHQPNSRIEIGYVKGIEIGEKGVEYKTDPYHSSGTTVHATREEAEVELAAVNKKLVEEDEQQFCRKKDKKDHSWGFNASYHRREAKDAKQKYEYHMAKLSVALALAKPEKAVKTVV